MKDDVQLYLGDCAVVMQEFDDESIDLTVTSPPYDNLRQYDGYVFDFESIANQLYRVTKKGGVVVWVVGDTTINGSESGSSFRQALYFKDIGFNLHDTMIYEKSGGPYPEKVRYYQVFEYMFVFSKGTPKTVNLIRDKVNIWAGTQQWGRNTRRLSDGNLEEAVEKRKIIRKIGIRNNIWRYAIGMGNHTTDKEAYEHPAIFPESLARDHILSWSNEGDIVLDPMMGSGTTIKMALRYNRKAIGIEISEKYYNLTKKRIKQDQLQVKLPL